MKKLICLLLALALLSSLWACTTAPVDDTEGSEPPVSQTPPETDPPTETDEPSTEPPTETDPPETEFVPPEGTLLTDAELDEFRALFDHRAAAYPELNWYNAAMSCTFDCPENVNWNMFFYDGLGDGEAELSEDEKEFCEQNGIALSMDVFRLQTDQMDAIAREYLGLTIAESNGAGLGEPSAPYYEATDSYYIYHGDTHIVIDFDMHSGAVLEDGTIRLYYCVPYSGEFVITLQPRTGEGETGYYILSNLPRES